MTDPDAPMKAGAGRLRDELRMVARGASHTHRMLRSRLAFLMAGTVVLDAVGTVLMYAFEHGRPDSGFHDVGGALFWVSAQLTTVSSQMPNPVTTPGRPREQDDVRRALRARAPRPPRVRGGRRGDRRLDERRPARPRPPRDRGRRRGGRRGRLRPPRRATVVRAGRLHGPPHVPAGGRGDSWHPPPGLLPRDPPVAVRPDRARAKPGGPHRRRARRRGEAVRARPRLRAGAQRGDDRYPDEAQIFRIDHFLGKLGLEETRYLRFANTIFEPMWNRTYVASVQITMAERFGVEERGRFYDPVGALRDVVVNHLMQVLAAVAMEPPAGRDPGSLHHAVRSVFRTMPAADPAHYVHGQYEGYRAIDGVAPGSTTETFAALRLEVDNWRWAGVPFFIRAGKRLPLTQTELRLVFRRPPRLGFLSEGRRRPEPDQLVVRLDPSTGVRLLVEAESAETEAPVQIHLDMQFAQQGGDGPSPYEVLLHAALVGDSTRFTRRDGVEEEWRVMQPLLAAPPPVIPYEPGSWGPREAEALLASHGRWHGPWTAA